MKLGMAVFSAMAGQLSIAAAITPAMGLRGMPGDLAFVMWGIGASSISDLGATRFWRAFYRKQSCPRYGFDDTMRPRARFVALRCRPWSTKDVPASAVNLRGRTAWATAHARLRKLHGRRCAFAHPTGQVPTGNEVIMYSNVNLFIDGAWRPAIGGKTLPVLNPATGEAIGTVAHAEKADLDLALAAAQKGFETWRKVSAHERYRLMRQAADILRRRAGDIAPLHTLEQGKPLAESKGETLAGADVIDWFAEEARRAYGRTVPARMDGVYQLEMKEPVGPVAAFTPWNFPINQAVRKMSCAVAAGCSIIIKGPEETPAACARLVDAFAQAGIPAGAVKLVFGVPSEISAYLIPHPVIRKISFTGSTVVGKQLAALAGAHMKRITMELGGHAPAIVFADADINAAAKILSANKYRNAGQVCVSPTRFLVQEPVYGEFVDKFVTDR